MSGQVAVRDAWAIREEGSMTTRSADVPLALAEARARRQARYLSGLLWHIGAFVILNAFFWALDLGLGRGGVHWAFWITGVWGVALAFHLLAYFVAGRGVEESSSQRYLARESRHVTGGR
jgi:2TM domain